MAGNMFRYAASSMGLSMPGLAHAEGSAPTQSPMASIVAAAPAEAKGGPKKIQMYSWVRRGKGDAENGNAGG